MAPLANGPATSLPEYLSDRLQRCGVLRTGAVIGSMPTATFESPGAVTTVLALSYAPASSGELPRAVVLKRYRLAAGMETLIPAK